MRYMNTVILDDGGGFRNGGVKPSGLAPIFVGLQCERDYKIYKNMMTKFLSGGGEIDYGGITVEFGKGNSILRVFLVGMTGNRFLFQTPLSDEAYEQLSGVFGTTTGKITMVNKMQYDTVISDFGDDLLIRRNISLNHEGKATRAPYSVGRNQPNFGQFKIGVGLDCFSIPLCADSAPKGKLGSVTRNKISAYEINASSEIISEGRNDEDVTLPLHMNSVEYMRLILTDGLLNWVSNSPILTYRTDEQVWRNGRTGRTDTYGYMDVERKMIGLKHLYSSKRYLTGTFVGVKGSTKVDSTTKKKYPFGELIVRFPPNNEDYDGLYITRSDKEGKMGDIPRFSNPNFYSVFDEPKTKANENIKRVDFDRVGINYHTYREMAFYTRGQYRSIGQLMDDYDIGAELVGMTEDGRLLYGMCDDTHTTVSKSRGMMCFITLDRLNTVVRPPDATRTRYLKSTYYHKWLEYSDDWCMRRGVVPSSDLKFVFHKYWNSGLVTEEDISEFKRLN